MMSGWNRQRASEAPRLLGHTWGICVLTAVLCLGSSPGISPAAPVLVLAEAEASSSEIRSYLQEDRDWLRRLPAGLTIAPAADSLTAVRAWVERIKGVAIHVVPINRKSDEFDHAEPQGHRDLLSLLRDRWLIRGYLAATVFPAEAGAETLLIAPGQVYHIRGLQVDGKDFAGRQWLLETILPRPGSAMQTDEWERSVHRLLVKVGDQGYPFARWMVRDVQVDRERAEVSIEAVLFPGVQAYLGLVTSSLPSLRSQDFLARASGLRTGNLFRQSDLQQARRRLLSRGLYTSVDRPLVYLTSASDTVGVYWPASLRQRTNRLGVVLGFNQDPADGAGQLSGQVDLLLPNLAGTGRRLDLRWSNDGDARSRLAFGYLEPLAFGTAFDVRLAVDHELLKEAYTRFSVALAGQLPLESTWGLELGAGWDRTTYPIGSVQQSSRWRIGGAFLHRRFDPARSGWEGRFSLQTAQRRATTRPDTTQDPEAVALVGQVQQRIIDLEIDGELWLGRVWSLASRAIFRQVTASDGSPIPISEQYWFGGAQTVRGYREDQFRGSQVAYGGIELRVGRAGGARLYTFFDMGYFSYSTDSPSPGEPAPDADRSGSMRGFGLGFQTKVPGGDISLAVGFPGSVNYEEAKLHVSLLEAF